MIEPFFSGTGLDRADPLRARPDQEIAQLAQRPDARMLLWQDGAPALDNEGCLVWTPVEGAPALFLGLDDGSPRFSSLPDGKTANTASGHHALLSVLDADEAPLFATALSLTNWHRRHGFCSNCGGQTVPNRAGWSRQCPQCAAEHYPRVDPVVIMLADFDGKLLLGRQPHYPPCRYSALAGFVEPGETVEAAVARELHEEAGIAVSDIRYLASQPWPFPSSLMIGAWARAEGDSLTIDHQELDDARWFTREQVLQALQGGENPPFLPPPRWAIARTLLEAWADGLK